MISKSKFLIPFAKYIHRKINKDAQRAEIDQLKWMNYLTRKAKDTKFGKDHGFKSIKNYQSFSKQIPVRDYEGLRSYVDLIVQGQENVLWAGKPKYFAKTSGTTSGIKYIPITKESMPYHVKTARDASLNLAYQKDLLGLFDGRLMFLSGSPTLENQHDILTGRLSGIVNHEVPKWLKSNQTPSFNTNCIEDWETKVDKIVEETYDKDLRLISGIPPWVQMYFERLLDYTGKEKVVDVFPNFKLFGYGGVNYKPYKQVLDSLIGAPIESLETYPASEGFVAFQDLPGEEGLLLNTNAGIFFEFIALSEIHSDNPIRLGIADVELDKDYAIILSTNAGLWSYNIGDTVRFVSKRPYRIIVSGRIKHFISAFGEHVISKEVESAMAIAIDKTKAEVIEFMVAPQVNPPGQNLPYHEWFISFAQIPNDITTFRQHLDESLQKQNSYYKDLRIGQILQSPKITILDGKAFQRYMESIGKLGGQNKVPRLTNDRLIADKLSVFTIK